MELDWLIVGGGIHGVHIAARLIGEAGISPDRLRVMDPADQLLSRWRSCTEITGMTHLRSPSVHHLDLNPWSLRRFAGKRRSRKRGLFVAPYERPALSLFNTHADLVIESFRLSELHVQQRATECSVDSRTVGVRTSDGEEIVARNLVLAIGASDQPEWPDWAPRGDARIRHVFDPGFDAWPIERETVAVVGGGISAAQVALRLVAEGHEVHLVSRHELRRHQFDSDPGWLGPKFMTRFQRETDVDRRRELIAVARNTGSVPPDVARAVGRATRADKLEWHEAEVDGVRTEGDRVELRLTNNAAVLIDRVLLATGFASRRPGGSMLDSLVTSASLPCAECGYPIVDRQLRWHPRIHVSGPLAELEVGPVSRNIAGARRAGDRIVDVALTG